MKSAPAREALLAAIRVSGRRRPLKRGPRQLPPDAQRLRYFAALRALVADCRAALTRHVAPHLSRWVSEGAASRADAGGLADINAAVDAAAAEVAAKWSAARFAETVQPIAQDTSSFAKRQIDATLKAQLGVDVLRTEPWLGDALRGWTSENVALVKTIPRALFGDVEAKLIAGVRAGERWERLSEMLQERAGVAESRAQLIARDQVGKLYGQLNERRMKDMGIGKFVWRTVRDNRVRAEHEDRAGQSYTWNELDPDERPGQPVQCRCYAEPDIADAFAAFESTI